MKHILLRLTLVFCIFWALSMVALAYTPDSVRIGIFQTETGTYGYHDYNIAKLTYKGEAVQTDMPAFILDDRTLVPIRVISERLGAEVEWIPDSRQVSISHADKTILLTIGSADALINGVSATLPDSVPAILAEYEGAERTLVPIRFVAEGLGSDVQWDSEAYTVLIDEPAKTYEVTGLAIDSAADAFTIETSEKAAFKIGYFGGKLVIDIMNATLGEDFAVPAFENAWVEQVRYSQYDGYDNVKRVVRVVFELKDGVGYPGNVTVDEASEGITVAYRPQEEIDPASFTVVIDAGHGGSDPGAVAGEFYESHINLDISMHIRDILQSAGINVVMTRTDDSYTPLSQRTELANASEADIFVSVHTNSSDTVPTAQGIETYYLAPGGSAQVLANSIQSAVILQTGAYDRGTKTANFVVLRETEMPAVLVETGFLTTESERALLLDSGYRYTLAQGIAAGIFNYLSIPNSLINLSEKSA